MPTSLLIVFAALAIVVVWAYIAIRVLRVVVRRFGPEAAAHQLQLFEELQRECEEFISQDPPRLEIPRRLLEANRVGQGNAVAAGTMLALTFAGMPVAPLIWMEAPLWLTVGLCTSLGILTGIVVVMVCSQSSSGRKHILENGVLVSGAVVKHTKIRTQVQDGTEQLWVTVGFEFDGEGRETTAKIRNSLSDRTKRLLDDEMPTRLLVDPLNLNKVLWVEGELLANPTVSP